MTVKSHPRSSHKTEAAKKPAKKNHFEPKYKIKPKPTNKVDDQINAPKIGKKIKNKRRNTLLEKYEKKKEAFKKAMARLANRTFSQKISDDPKRFEVFVNCLCFGIMSCAIIGLISCFSMTFSNHYTLVWICLGIAALCMILMCLFNRISELLEEIKKDEQKIVENQCKDIQETTEV